MPFHLTRFFIVLRIEFRTMLDKMSSAGDRVRYAMKSCDRQPPLRTSGCRRLLWSAGIVLILSLSGPACRHRNPWNIMPEGRMIDPAITESSGVVASRRYEDVLWTHNDAHNLPELFAIDDDGELLQTYLVPGVENIDWEDIGIDADNNLYILDNAALRRDDHLNFIYIIPEPNPFEDVEVEK